MARKYCPICYFEHEEQILVSTNGGKATNGGATSSRHQQTQAFICKKRGHVSKGSGLSLEELRKLNEFRKLEL